MHHLRGSGETSSSVDRLKTMRGRILEVHSLLDYTLLRQPRREVARLVDVGRDADGVKRGDTVQESQDNVRQQCEMHGVAVAAQRLVEGALVNDKGSFNMGRVSSLSGISELGGSVTSFLVTGLQRNS